MRALYPLPVLLAAMLVGCATGDRPPEPENRVVILIDGSISYADRQQEAIDRTQALLATMSEAEVRRWESDRDRIAIISVDALPDVLWEGTLRDLQAMDPDAWARRFAARSDYAGCTDVAAAFRLAARHLGDEAHVQKYLFAFSDLVHEPPTSSLRSCASPVALPDDAAFPWAELADVSVSAFWLPPDQKLAWQRAAADRGLQTVALYTTSESAAVDVAPPPRPVAERMTDEERQARRDQLAETGSSLLVGLGVGFVAVLVLVVGGAYALSRRRRAPAVPPLRVTRPANRPGAPGPNGTPRRPAPRPTGRPR